MKVLVKELKQKRMTRATLGEKLGVSQVTISKWVSGACSPNFENMDALKELGFSDTACLEPSKDVEV